jgi:hypothetical protein
MKAPCAETSRRFGLSFTLQKYTLFSVQPNFSRLFSEGQAISALMQRRKKPKS